MQNISTSGLFWATNKFLVSILLSFWMIWVFWLELFWPWVFSKCPKKAWVNGSNTVLSETNLKEKALQTSGEKAEFFYWSNLNTFFVRLLVPNTPDTAVSSSWASDPVGVSRRVPCRSTWPGSPPSPYAWPWWVGTYRCRSSPGSRPNPLKGQVGSITQNVRNRRGYLQRPAAVSNWAL